MLDVFHVDSDFSPKYLQTEYVPGRVGNRWHGSLVRVLCPMAKPDAKGLAALLSKRALRTAGRPGARAGIHLTWAAPKSVSVCALVGEHVKLIQAHEESVLAALGFVERHTTCRVSSGNRTRSVGVKNWATLICHRTNSRADDPHLHSLVTIFNGADCGDGVVRAIENKFFYASKKALGSIYLHEFRRRVAELGYAVIEGEDGLWDIAGVPDSVLAVFSTRRAQITEVVRGTTGKAPKDLSPDGQREFARRTGRRRDDVPGFNALSQRWAQRSEMAGFVAPAIPAPIHSGTQARSTQTVLQDAILAAHGRLRKSNMRGVPLPDVLSLAMRLCPAASVDATETALSTLCSSGTFLCSEVPEIVYDRRDQEPRATTAESAQCETSQNDAKLGCDNGTRDISVKVVVTDTEMRRAKRFMLNRGYASFGHYLTATFGGNERPARPSKVVVETASRRRTLQLKGRVDAEVHSAIVSWAGEQSISAALRMLVCGVVARITQGAEAQTPSNGETLPESPAASPAEPEDQWIKVLLTKSEKRAAESLLREAGCKTFKDFLQRHVLDQPVPAGLPGMEPRRPVQIGERRTYDMKARVSARLKWRLKEWANGEVAPSLRTFMMCSPLAAAE